MNTDKMPRIKNRTDSLSINNKSSNYPSRCLITFNLRPKPRSLPLLVVFTLFSDVAFVVVSLRLVVFLRVVVVVVVAPRLISSSFVIP